MLVRCTGPCLDPKLGWLTLQLELAPLALWTPAPRELDLAHKGLYMS
jgi:hypothetical protein